MRPNTLKSIDNTLGRVLLVVLRPLVLLIDTISAKRTSPATPKKISFLKILGGGSLLIAYPAVLGIRRRYPDAHMTLVCAKEVKAYADLTDVFDEIIEIDTDSPFRVVASSLRALYKCGASDVFVNYELHSKLSAIFTFMSFSKERYGLYQDWNRWQERYINHPIFYNSATPIYVGYEQIAQKIGGHAINWTEACQHFQRFLEFRKLADEAGAVKIGIAAYCSDLYKERQFSNREFSNVIWQHVPPQASEIILLGGKNDRVPATELATLLARPDSNTAINNMAGKTSLRDVVTLFQSMAFLVSIDSGLNHLARLLGLKTITYWGPSDPHLRLKAIDVQREVVMYHKIACSPCVHLIDVPPCNGKNLCMQQFLDKKLIERSNEGWEIT